MRLPGRTPLTTCLGLGLSPCLSLSLQDLQSSTSTPHMQGAPQRLGVGCLLLAALKLRMRNMGSLSPWIWSGVE